MPPDATPTSPPSAPPDDAARPDDALCPDDTVDFGLSLARLLAADEGPGDDIGDWQPVDTPAGRLRLEPVVPERDLPLLHGWMNDPDVAAFWQLAGPEELTARHVRAQLVAGHSVPCLGVLDGTPMSYWEIYRADLDPLARHYPARPHDTGLHLLLGGAADRGRGLGTLLIRTVSDLVLDHRPACERVVAEPDLRNFPSVAAFLNAGFRFHAELGLPGKRAALMVRDRVLRHSEADSAPPVVPLDPHQES